MCQDKTLTGATVAPQASQSRVGFGGNPPGFGPAPALAHDPERDIHAFLRALLGLSPFCEPQPPPKSSNFLTVRQPESTMTPFFCDEIDCGKCDYR
jgi:hypothetical protein